MPSKYLILPATEVVRRLEKHFTAGRIIFRRIYDVVKNTLDSVWVKCIFLQKLYKNSNKRKQEKCLISIYVP